MSLQSELIEIINDMKIPYDVGYFQGERPSDFIIITPLSDYFGLYTDDKPKIDIQEIRISLFCKSNYFDLVDKLIKRLLDTDFTVTNRHYVEFEHDTRYHHYNIDIAKHFEMESGI